MFKVLKWIIGLFSPYVNSFERKVDKFFKHVKSTDSIAGIRKKLLELMQENLVVLSVWMEKKYKGYTYLGKSTRRRMYRDIVKINDAFFKFVETHKVDELALKKVLDGKGLNFPHGDEDKIVHLYHIMKFLRPGNHYHYISTASFGKLLRDPATHKLEGDCNQIVTFYIYLFSLKFPVEALEIKLLPEHVCLHFRGIDIEATNGTFQKYVDEREVLPVTEIVSTNMLDVADFREDVIKIAPRDMVKSAQLAYSVSSLKTLVAKNLAVAYHNLAISAMDANDYDTAIFYLQKKGDRELLIKAYTNAAIYYLKSHNFKKAKYYAGQSYDNDLKENVDHNEAVYLYKKEAAKVTSVRTVADAKKHKSSYVKMRDLARRMGDSKLERQLQDTLSKI